MKGDAQPTLEELVAAATPADGQRLDARIAQKRAELEEVTGRLRNELDALLALRKVLAIRLRGKPPRGKGGPRRLQPASAAVAAADTTETSSSDVECKVAEPEKPTVADRIQGLIELRGPLSTSRLAQLLTASESGVRIAIGRAKGRFIANEDGDWIVKE